MKKISSFPPLMVGSTRVDITPPITVPYLGYASSGRHQFFRGVHDPLYAKATVISDGEREVALVVADSIGFARRSLLGADRDFTGEVRQKVEQLCGIPPVHTMICATHAHSTPETIGFRSLLQHAGGEAWLEMLMDQLASAVAMAKARVAPARLKRAVGRVEGISHSRRILGKDGRLYHWANRPPEEEVDDWGVNDFDVVVLSFENMEGHPETTMVHFACHPVTVQVQPLVSADFPGAAAALVENANVGCLNAVYLQGACGSINTIRGTTDFDDVRRYGQTLGGEVIKLMGLMSAPDYPTHTNRVDAAVEVVELPSRDLPDLQSLEQERMSLEHSRDVADSEEGRQQCESALLVLDEHFERVRKGNDPVTAEVQVLRVGDTALVGIPGEPFAQLGVDIKGLCPNQTTTTERGGSEETAMALCLGYANDYLGYIAPVAEWDRGGYEVSLGMWSIVGPEAYQILLNAAQKLVSPML